MKVIRCKKKKKRNQRDASSISTRGLPCPVVFLTDWILFNFSNSFFTVLSFNWENFSTLYFLFSSFSTFLEKLQTTFPKIKKIKKLDVDLFGNLVQPAAVTEYVTSNYIIQMFESKINTVWSETLVRYV